MGMMTETLYSGAGIFCDPIHYSLTGMPIIKRLIKNNLLFPFAIYISSVKKSIMQMTAIRQATLPLGGL